VAEENLRPYSAGSVRMGSGLDGILLKDFCRVLCKSYSARLDLIEIKGAG